MNVNKALIYDVGPALDALRDARCELRAAEQKVHTLEDGWKSTVSRCTGNHIDLLDFSNAACMARGVVYHVYHRRTRVCVFCGCTDD